MLQLVQMTRHAATWLGWTPGPVKAGGAGCECLPADDELVQESSGLATVLMLYVAIAVLFLVVNHCTGRAKPELAALERRQFQTARRSSSVRRSGSPSGIAPAAGRMPHAPEWLATLPDLIRQVAAPRRPTTLYRQRLRQQDEPELELHRDQDYLRQEQLQEKEQDQLNADWQDAVDEDPPSSGQAPAQLVSLPQRQNSIYFDLPSEAE
ncbi:uncharacterized protein [Drosophila bipectinata]|uniref:uncharacterized protein n=1 Tax=Drosophila bipectinata TaxID=42026 RepID=UPI001C89911E|nr:uncharacterized protein LOC108119526 [Drosophila bipectinata]